MAATTHRDDEAPGWDAIDASLRRIYGELKPFHYGPILPYLLGGKDPLNGISIYRNGSHWHYVTYGFSELYAKENDDPSISGFGFELTFRLVADAADEPPQWPLNLLQNLARYVFQSGRVFCLGHKMDLHGPIALDEQTKICAITIIEDPQLLSIDSPNGKLQFLQIVGITQDEYDMTMEWDCQKFAYFLARENPLLITDLRRNSVLDDPTKALAIREKIESDGSSHGITYSTQLTWKHDRENSVIIVVIGAGVIPQFKKVLKARLKFDRDYFLQGPERITKFVRAEQPAWSISDTMLTVSLTHELIDNICSRVEPLRGKYSDPRFPEMIFQVIPTEIQDGTGKETVQVIG